MKRLLFVCVCISVILLYANSCNAKVYNDGYIKAYVVKEKLSKELIRYTTRITKKIMKEINYDCKVIVSPYSLEGAWGYTNVIDRYICIACPNKDYKSIRDTVLHEIGHMKMKDMCMREYVNHVYNEDYQYYSDWNMKYEEEFAEDYRVYMLRTKYFQTTDNFEKRTSRLYSYKATRFIRKLKNNGIYN